MNVLAEERDFTLSRSSHVKWCSSFTTEVAVGNKNAYII